MGWEEEFALGLAAGAVATYAVLVTLRWVLARREAPRAGALPASVFGYGSEGSPPPSREGRPGTVSSPGADLWPGLPAPALTPNGPAASDHTLPVEALPTPSQVRLSGRIVLHLFFLGRIGPDDVGLPGGTQQGIGDALRAEQSAVSKVLRRLVAAEVLVVSRRHVRGRERRLNVYTLTRRGELLAHELRARMPPPTDGPPRVRVVHREGPAPPREPTPSAK